MNANASLIAPLIRRLALVMVLFSVLRLLFWASNHSYFPGIGIHSFLGGLRFDLSSLVFLNLPVIILSLIPLQALQNSKWYRLLILFLFCGFNAFAFGLEFADIEYFKFTLKRSTFDLFGLIGTGDDMKNLFPVFVKDYWYLILAWILTIILLIFYGRKTYTRFNGLNNWKSFAFWAMSFVLIIGASVIAFRGGFQLKPVSVINASAYGGNRYSAVVLNTSFSMIQSFGKPRLPEKKYYEPRELDKLYSPVYKPIDTGEIKNRNVVIIILESFAEEYVGALSGKKSYTPFLDSLINHSYRPQQGFANGRKSMEALPAILAGIPAWMNRPYISSSYSVNEIESLSSVLSSEGYSTAFFHGGNNGTMGFDRFSKAINIQTYYGREEYDNDADYDGQWGIFDRPFLQYTLGHLNAMHRPFFATIFTLSSHHPYKVPEAEVGLYLEGSLPIHPTIQYTDDALREFFQKAKKQDWFENTLFVITADHTHHSEYPEYITKIGQYRVPLIFYASDLPAQKFDGLGQHIDILPTVLDYLNYNQKVIAFGESLLENRSAEIVMNYINGQYQVNNHRYVLYTDGDVILSLYDFQSDPLLTNDLKSTEKEIAKSLLESCQMRIQSFNHRMNNNLLQIP